MIKLFFMSMVLFSSITFVDAQHVLKNDTLYLKKGGFLTKNSKLKLGKGTSLNGNFKHIEVNINNIMRNRELDKVELEIQDVHSLSGKFSNKDGRVIRIIERGKKKEDKKYFAIIGVGDIKRYQVAIDKAIEVGEIILDNQQIIEKNLFKNILTYSNKF